MFARAREISGRLDEGFQQQSEPGAPDGNYVGGKAGEEAWDQCPERADTPHPHTISTNLLLLMVCSLFSRSSSSL